jgi:hypothetical protein
MLDLNGLMSAVSIVIARASISRGCEFTHPYEESSTVEAIVLFICDFVSLLSTCSLCSTPECPRGEIRIQVIVCKVSQINTEKIRKPKIKYQQWNSHFLGLRLYLGPISSCGKIISSSMTITSGSSWGRSKSGSPGPTKSSS